MKIIVFSDSHGDEANMLSAIRANRDAECFFHLGDGQTEFDGLCRREGVRGVSVSGNCDRNYLFGLPFTPTANVELGGFRFFLTHGHRYHVDGGTDILLEEGAKNGADVILYGHTHIRENRYYPAGDGLAKPVYIFNPGSVSHSRSGANSFGVIIIKEKNILLSHGLFDELW